MDLVKISLKLPLDLISSESSSIERRIALILDNYTIIEPPAYYHIDKPHTTFYALGTDMTYNQSK